VLETVVLETVVLETVVLEYVSAGLEVTPSAGSGFPMTAPARSRSA
jgi:hypothetical protein